MALAALVFALLPATAQTVIQAENGKTAGVTPQWFITDADYASAQEIEGYASASSVNRGGSIRLYVQTKTDASYTIQIYRAGWYGGVGGRLMAGPITRSRTAQPPCAMTDTSTRLIECNWTDPYVLNIPNNTADPSDWASGVYLAKLTGTTTGKQSYIVFVVRDDARRSLAMFQTSVTTYVAYNTWGGYDFYSNPPAYKLSFNRPYFNSERHLGGKGAGDFLSWEINMLRFVEREGYDVKYVTDVDTHVNPGSALNTRLFLSVGHDEYYTKSMYDALEAARNAGVNLGFFGANNIYWQIRLEPATLTGEANRTVVGYKYAPDPIVATNPTLATYLWRETVRAPINRPEAALIGVMYDYNSVDLDLVMTNCTLWVCAGANAAPGQVLPGLLGYEVDRIFPSSPPGVTAITTSPYDACLDAACTTKERRFANSSYYTAASGAGVFAAGSMQWTWGLDPWSPGPRLTRQDEHGDRSSPVIQQITRNVLTRFTAVGGNNAPQITSAPVTTAAPSTAYTYDVNAVDPNGDALNFALVQAPAGMIISAANGLINWTPTAAQTGPQAVTVRVSDAGGLTATQTFAIGVGSFTRCAGEGGTCSFSGTRTVRYGANGIYASRTATGSILCSNSVFGDPVPGVTKQCEVQTDATSATVTTNPVFTPPAGTYGAAQTVALVTPTPNASIFYTLDGSTPTTGSPQYAWPLTIAASATVNAIAVSSGRTGSGVSSAAYTIAGGWIRCATEGGTCTFSGTRTVRFGANGVYATRTATGSILCSNTVFGDPVPNVVKACEVSDTTSTATAAAAPTFSPAGGTFASAQTVTLASATSGATIYYTTNGTTPTTSSTVYTGPITVSATTTIKALAAAAGLASSAVSTATYTIGTTATWTRCAGEGQTCTFSGTRTVRYGANGVYATRTATGSILCSNTVFGDPTPGVPKQCDVQ